MIILIIKIFTEGEATRKKAQAEQDAQWEARKAEKKKAREPEKAEKAEELAKIRAERALAGVEEEPEVEDEEDGTIIFRY